MTRRLFPATVVSPVPIPWGIVVVHVDGSISPLEAVNLTGRRLGLHSRVMIDFVEPNGAYVMGTLYDTATTPMVHAFKDSTQTIPDDTATAVVFDDVGTEDIYGFWDGSDTFTIPSGLGGTYAIAAAIRYEDDADGTRRCIIAPDPGRNRIATVHGSGGSGGAQVTVPSLAINGQKLDDGDTVEVRALHNAGGNLDIAAEDDTFVTLVRVGD